MIEIKYLKTRSGLDNCFQIWFEPIEDYIPEINGEFENRYTWTERQYYTWLFDKNGLFSKGSKGKEIIWSTVWECSIDGIPFTMSHDEDYDIVSFSVEEEYIPQLEHIAERIKSLIEKEANICD